MSSTRSAGDAATEARPAPAVSDRDAIARLAATFDDAVNRRSVEGFCALWAQDAEWTIGPPREMRAVGIEDIRRTWTAMLEQTVWLFRGSYAGVIDVDGDVARGRWPCTEVGSFKAEGKYENFAMYEDEYRRTDGGWVFARRSYAYLRLTTDIVPPTQG